MEPDDIYRNPLRITAKYLAVVEPNKSECLCSCWYFYKTLFTRN